MNGRSIKPVTVFTDSIEQAIHMAGLDPDGRALASSVGTLSFHKLIAEHASGQFKTLYAPWGSRHEWRRPVGGEERRA